MSTRSRSAWSIVFYTVLRLAIFGLAWFLIEFFTPINGLFAAAFAILISGAISIVALNGQRDAMSEVLYGFFRRMNARIDASARAEDVDD
jgi:membrane-bound ClpP family serine protease